MVKRNEEFRLEIMDMQRKTIKLNRKQDILQVEIDELMDEIDPSRIVKGKKDGPVKVKNPAILKKIREEKKKRERELLKQRLAKAIDAVDQSNYLDIERNTEKGFLEKTAEAIGQFLDNLKPFPNEIYQIQLNYDKGIGIFF